MYYENVRGQNNTGMMGYKMYLRIGCPTRMAIKNNLTQFIECQTKKSTIFAYHSELAESQALEHYEQSF